MRQINNLHAEYHGRLIFIGSLSANAVEAQKLLGISLEGSVG